MYCANIVENSDWEMHVLTDSGFNGAGKKCDRRRADDMYLKAIHDQQENSALKKHSTLYFSAY